MSSTLQDILMHYGMPRRSGRYPWGSGDNPYQHNDDFLSRVEELKKNGWTETPENIMKEFGLSTTQYRTEKSLATNERRMLQVARAKSLREDGLGYTEIGRKMGINESSVRSLLDPKTEERMLKATETADFLREQIETKGMIDVGAGIERELGISRVKLENALYILNREGYPVYGGGVKQINNPGQQTNQLVICPKGTEYKEIYNYDQVHTINEYTSHDGGQTFHKFIYPESLDSGRIKIRYAEEGGLEKDGIVEIRRGVNDLSLGDSRYSQVRILVDGTHYIKGMAVYSDNMPDGVDLIFNTNKKVGTDKMAVLKEIKKDPDNPFGSLIKPDGQSFYDDPNGKYIDPITGKKQSLSLINKRADQGDWSEWKDALPSQFLDKQSLAMAKKQLGLAKADKYAEYEDICALNNPTIKRHLLKKFADECDSAAVHLQAAALPGQKYHVIIPVNTLKDTEVFAPGYSNGTKLALIRYPHAGIFEIPILTVNNKNSLAKELIGVDAIDAIGINSKIATQLSGADFDGDTVMCIPTHDKSGKVKIASRPYLKELVGFEPKEAYGADQIDIDEDGNKHYYRNGKEYRIMSDTQKQMGVASNLITDMTLAGATDDELAAAVRHSMVVIDAEKHKLDYKQSEIDNNITALKKKYQVKTDKDGNVDYGGASTILSRAKGQQTVTKRQGTPHTNVPGDPLYDPSKPEGSLIFKTADKLYYPERSYDKKAGTVTLKTTNGKKVTYNVNDKEAVEKYEPIESIDPKTGKVTYTNRSLDISYVTNTRTQKSTRMAETDDAHTLVSTSKHPMELVYADYANSMKSLANQARKEVISTGNLKYDKTAKQTYQAEVSSLMKKLDDAQLNAPRMRQAERLANAEVKAKQAANPDMTKDEIKKAGQQALTKYRNEVGTVSRKERNIDITDREWEAIQAGAISDSKLTQILNNTDIDKLRERATPRTTNELSTTKINQIKSMSASNYTLEQIAKKLGVSTSAVSKYLKGGN